MCGIAGFINLDHTPADPELLRKMADTMKLRGPDGEGFHIDGSLGLAHRRLSIIDLEGGAQPITNENNTIFIIVNGEIYNFPVLRKELEKLGHRFRTRSDSECALHAYEEYGLDFAEKLDGMFAIAIYDSRQKKLILARDRSGEKPLFLLHSERVFAFASSVNALKLIEPEPEIDVREYLSFQYSTGGTGILPMDKASVLEFDPEKNLCSCHRYWHPQFVPVKSSASFSESAEKLRSLVTESVRARMVSDVPLGVFLSGGLDSAVIAAAASKVESDEPLKCFSIGFRDSSYDESAQAERSFEYIRERAARPLEFHHKIVDPEDFEVFRSVLQFYGRPFGDSSVLPTSLLCRFAREQVKVALSGDGADELFGGYERTLVMHKLEKLDRIPGFLRKFVFGLAAALIPGGGGDRTASARLKRLLTAASLDPVSRYLFLISAFTEQEKKDLFAVPYDSASFLTQFGERFRSPEYFDFHYYLPYDILTKTDTASMMSSLEVRAPFLSRDIMDFAEKLPQEYKVRGIRRKAILSEAFSGWIPPELATIRKRGFGIPLAAWMRGPWKSYLEELIPDDAFLRSHDFRRSFVEKLMREHFSGKFDHSKKLCALLTLRMN